MATGIVCICGGKGGIPKTILDQVNGYLVNSQSELTKEIVNIINNESIKSINKNIRKNTIGRANDFDIKNILLRGII